jgi:hypothetical protein
MFSYVLHGLFDSTSRAVVGDVAAENFKLLIVNLDQEILRSIVDYVVKDTAT